MKDRLEPWEIAALVRRLEAAEEVVREARKHTSPLHEMDPWRLVSLIGAHSETVGRTEHLVAS